MKLKIRRKENGGITLIALVITTIVLVILAGVTIVGLTGENGILTQVRESKIQTEIGEENEAVELAYTGAKIEKNGEDVDAEDLNTQFAKNGINAIASGAGTITVTFPDTNRNYKIDRNGNVKYQKPIDYPTLATETTSVNYGDYVNYDMDYDKDGSTSDDWRIYYNDGERIYLIASEYVCIDEIPTIAYSDTYSLNFENMGFSKNDEVINFLLEKEEWTKVLGNDKAEYVTGATSIEMFINSWNQKHSEEKRYWEKGENGYYIGNTENPTDFSMELSQDDLYCIQKGTDPCSTKGMWIASQTYDNKILRTIDNTCGGLSNINGRIAALSSTHWYIGIRPIVCLKAEVILRSGEGTIDSPFEIEVHK